MAIDMESLNLQVTELFNAYITAKNLTGLVMNQHFERIIWEAVQMGLKPEDLVAVIHARQRGVREGGRRSECLLMRNLFGVEATAEVLDEAAAIRATKRMRLVDPAKASILRQTGREEKAPETPAKPASEVPLIEALRKAAQ